MYSVVIGVVRSDRQDVSSDMVPDMVTDWVAFQLMEFVRWNAYPLTCLPLEGALEILEKLRKEAVRQGWSVEIREELESDRIACFVCRGGVLVAVVPEE